MDDNNETIIMYDKDETRNHFTWALGRRSCYGELLQSGNFADVDIKCGSRTWKCHRAIICTRNEWFRAAFGGSFNEAKDLAVNIEEMDEGLVEVLLQYLYTSRVNLRECLGDEYLLRSTIRVWKMADFFLCDELKSLAVDCFRAAMRRFVGLYGMDLIYRTLPDFRPEEVDHLVDALRFLYQDDEYTHAMKPFKSVLMGVALCATKVLAQSDNFNDLLRSCPAFSVDWSLELMDCCSTSQQVEFQGHLRPPEPRTTPSNDAKRCDACRQAEKFMSIPMYPNLIKWVKTGQSEMVCCDLLYNEILEREMNAFKPPNPKFRMF